MLLGPVRYLQNPLELYPTLCLAAAVILTLSRLQKRGSFLRSYDFYYTVYNTITIHVFFQNREHWLKLPQTKCINVLSFVWELEPRVWIHVHPALLCITWPKSRYKMCTQSPHLHVVMEGLIISHTGRPLAMWSRRMAWHIIGSSLTVSRMFENRVPFMKIFTACINPSRFPVCLH